MTTLVGGRIRSVHAALRQLLDLAAQVGGIGGASARSLHFARVIVRPATF